MTTIVGVSDFTLLDNEGAAKRAALLCDQLTFTRHRELELFSSRAMNAFESYLGHKPALIEYLLENQVAIEAPREYDSPERMADMIDTIIYDQTPEGAALRDAFVKLVHDERRAALPGVDRTAREAALRLRQAHGWDAVVLSEKPAVAEGAVSPGRDVVLRVVLNALPEPDDATPWDAIVEYRNDPESRRKLVALKRWVNAVSRGESPASELEDEVEHLVAEYRAHLRAHRLRTGVGSLETIVTAAAEVAENVVKIRWSRAAGALFSLSKRAADLLDAERQAPGRELAYIVDARATFSG
jgi:hypothetical protein